jgi:hypothetical protein
MWGQPLSAVRPGEARLLSPHKFIRATSQLNAGTIFSVPAFFLPTGHVNPR